MGGGMISTSVGVAEAARAAGATVMHAPISFKEDASDNPNKGVGILAGCAGDKLFTEGTWNAEFCKGMTPKDGDCVATTSEEGQKAATTGTYGMFSSPMTSG